LATGKPLITFLHLRIFFGIHGSIIKTLNSTSFNKTQKIDTSTWQSGIYFVNLINNNTKALNLL